MAMPTFVTDSAIFNKTAATFCCILAGGLLFVACSTKSQTAEKSDFATLERPLYPHEVKDKTDNTPCIYGQMGKVGMLADTPSDYIPPSAPAVEQAQDKNPQLTQQLEKLNEQYQEFYTHYMSLLEDMKTLAAVKDKVTNIKLELADISAIPQEKAPAPFANTEMVIMDDGTVLRRTISPDPLESSISAVDRPIDITALRTPGAIPVVTQEPPPEKAVIVEKVSPAPPVMEKAETQAITPVVKTAAPTPEKTPEPQLKTAENKSVEQALLSGTFLSAAERVRIGEHPGKKRFVIDFAPGSIIDYKKNLANRELTVTLSDTAWKGRKTWTSSNANSPIKSYRVETTASGSILHISLTDSASVTKLFDMPPESSTEGPKLVIDITG